MIFFFFFSAYPSTGSFSRTAIKARSGVRTPIAGVFSSIVVVLALYVLTPAFYYIPDSILAAVVIHAVSDLVASPKYIRQIYKINIWELMVFVVSVTVTFFTAVEYGIYASIGVSILLLLFKISRPRFYNIGRIPLALSKYIDPSLTLHGNIIPNNDIINNKNKNMVNDNDYKDNNNNDDDLMEKDQMQYLYIPDTDSALGHLVQPLPDGILMVRMDESWIYPNCGFLADTLIVHCKNYTRRAQAVISKGGRAWNDDADPIKDAARAQLPLLHALIIDFTRVNQLDSSGLQSILDVQNALNRYSGHYVELHFVNIADPIIRQTLIIGGFGNLPGQDASLSEYSDKETTNGGDDQNQEDIQMNESYYIPNVAANVPKPRRDHHHHHYQQNQHPNSTDIEYLYNNRSQHSSYHNDQITLGYSSQRFSQNSKNSSIAIPMPRDRYPLFHFTADDAVRAAVSSLNLREQSYIYYPSV